MEKLQLEFKANQVKLSNHDFLNRAKPEAIEKVRMRAEELNETLVRLKDNLAQLG